MIHSEATHYHGQTHPCWGVQVVGWGQTTRFMPWVFDGRWVRWLNARETNSAARAAAQEQAHQLEPVH